MTATESSKSPVEQFTFASNKAFKDSFEKSYTALSEFNAYSKKNFEALVASMTSATKGAETLGANAVAYAKQAIEDQVAATRKLAGAKSVQEVVELQTSYAKSAFEAYVAEMSRMAETAASSVKETVAPINERVTAFVERVQSHR